MEEFHLHFNNAIFEFEETGDWVSATEYAFRDWENDPINIRKLLCAGTELWYGMLLVDYYKYSPMPATNLLLPEFDKLEHRLNTVAKFGFNNFVDSPAFNMYFGYMIKCMPYYFLDYGGKYDDWQKKGIDMIKYACTFKPNNPLLTAMLYLVQEQDECFVDSCRELWHQVTPDKWGNTQVQQYFFRILNGESFYPKAYNCY